LWKIYGKEKIVLEDPLLAGGKAEFCCRAHLLWYLKEMCPKTFEIKPTQLAYKVNKKVQELSW
jgi:hypothetical protein